MTDFGALNMFSTAQPGRAMALAALLFSLAGIPPLVGFFGKFYVLRAAVDAGMAWLALLAVIASVIGAYYYLRLIYFMYFGGSAEPLSSRISTTQVLALYGAALAMILGVFNFFGFPPLFGVEALAADAANSLLK